MMNLWFHLRNMAWHPLILILILIQVHRGDFIHNSLQEHGQLKNTDWYLNSFRFLDGATPK